MAGLARPQSRARSRARASSAVHPPVASSTTERWPERLRPPRSRWHWRLPPGRMRYSRVWTPTQWSGSSGSGPRSGVAGRQQEARHAGGHDARGRRRPAAAAPPRRPCPTGGTTRSTTRSPPPWRWGRCPRGTSRAWPWTLGARLPGSRLRLPAGGILTLAKAEGQVAAVFEPLDEGEAARAEALILPEVAGKTYFQVEELARPGRPWPWRRTWPSGGVVGGGAGAGRGSLVFREESGAVGLSGRDLPAGQALACSRQRRCPRKGVRGVRRLPRTGHPGALGGTRLPAFLLNGVTAADAIASRPRRHRGTARRVPGKMTRTPTTRTHAARPTIVPTPRAAQREPRWTIKDLMATGRTQVLRLDGPGGDGPGSGGGAPVQEEYHAALPEVTVPLATLQGRTTASGRGQPAARLPRPGPGP